MIKNFLKTKEFIGSFPILSFFQTNFVSLASREEDWKDSCVKREKKKEKKEGRIFRIRIERKFINRIYTGSEVNGKQREETTFRVKAGKR